MMLPTFPLPVPEEWLGAVREGGRGRRREKGEERGGEGRGKHVGGSPRRC